MILYNAKLTCANSPVAGNMIRDSTIMWPCKINKNSKPMNYPNELDRYRTGITCMQAVDQI